MKRMPLLFILSILVLSCEKKAETIGSFYTARIVDYDRNCQSCILAFPEDTLQVTRYLGESDYNLYHAVNLHMDNFIIGQNIIVRLREVNADEVPACIELYGGNNYKDVYAIGVESISDLKLSDTISINNFGCVSNSDKRISICMDSVLNDSRCANGAVCIWAGDATVYYSFTVNDETYSFDLHTNSSFQKDTLIKGYNIQLISLSPYPSLDTLIKKEDYYSNIVLSK